MKRQTFFLYFYNELETTLETLSRRAVFLILGDFNAKIGQTDQDEHLRKKIAKFSLGAWRPN